MNLLGQIEGIREQASQQYGRAFNAFSRAVAEGQHLVWLAAHSQESGLVLFYSVEDTGRVRFLGESSFTVNLPDKGYTFDRTAMRVEVKKDPQGLRVTLTPQCWDVLRRRSSRSLDSITCTLPLQ
jgi:hypothetical protein